MTYNHDVEVARLNLKVDNLTADREELSRKVEFIEDKLAALQREHEKWLNRGIGVGLAIGSLGGIGGFLLAQLKAKLGLP